MQSKSFEKKVNPSTPFDSPDDHSIWKAALNEAFADYFAGLLPVWVLIVAQELWSQTQNSILKNYRKRLSFIGAKRRTIKQDWVSKSLTKEYPGTSGEKPLPEIGHFNF